MTSGIPHYVLILWPFGAALYEVHLEKGFLLILLILLINEMKHICQKKTDTRESMSDCLGVMPCQQYALLI